MNKIYFISFLMIIFSLETFASYPFNGVFCGRGTFTMQGQAYSGIKTLDVMTTNDSLRLKGSKITLDSGGYVEGRPEQADIVNDEIIYQNAVIGTISDAEIHTAIHISGYDIEYFVRNIGVDKISYLRTSVNGSFSTEENFPEMILSATCP